MSFESIEIGSPSLTETSNDYQNLPDDSTDNKQGGRASASPFLFGALVNLQNTSHLFIKKMDDQKFDGENGYTRHYDVIDSFGIRLFQCVERTPKELRKQRGQTHFVIALMDSRGEALFHFEGQIGEKYDVIRDDHVWGGVPQRIFFELRDIYPVEFWKQDSGGVPINEPIRSDHPIVTTKKKKGLLKSKLKDNNKDNKGDDDQKSYMKFKTQPKVVFAEPIIHAREVLYIVGEKYDSNMGCCGCAIPLPESRIRRIRLEIEAEVYLPDRVTKVGRLGKNWTSADGIKCERSELLKTIGIHFPKRTDVRIKVILIGALFMIDDTLFTSSS